MSFSILRRWKQRRVTIAEFAQLYDQHLLSLHLSPKTLTNRRNCLRHLVERIGTMPLREVRPSHVTRAITTIHSAGLKTTARRVLWEAESLFQAAIVEGLIDTNPATPVKTPPAPVARARLMLEEWREIYAWSEQHARPWASYALLLALVTGQRRSDLVAMRHSHVIGGHLRVEQAKTGARIELPLALRLDAVEMTLAEVIELANDYRRPGDLLLRKRDDQPFNPASLSCAFHDARDAIFDPARWAPKLPPTLHEIRSLSERLYRAQGIDTRTLLGHRRQSMTDAYNDDRGRSAGEWKRLTL